MRQEIDLFICTISNDSTNTEKLNNMFETD